MSDRRKSFLEVVTISKVEQIARTLSPESRQAVLDVVGSLKWHLEQASQETEELPASREDEVEEATECLKQNYYASVQTTATMFVQRLKAGEFIDADNARQALEDAASDSHWSKDTTSAYQCLSSSDNEMAAWNELHPRISQMERLDVLSALATLVFRFDVTDEVEGALIGDDDVEDLDEWFKKQTKTKTKEYSVHT